MTTSNQLQREAAQHRQELSNSLDGLRAAATPSHLTNEILTLAKDSGASVVRALADQARSNPIPALLIGAGLFMLLTRSASGSYGVAALDRANDTLRSTADTGVDAVRGMAQNTRRAAAGAVAEMSDLARDSARRASNSASDVVDKASDVVDKASGMAQEAAGRAREALSRAEEVGSAAMAGAQASAGQMSDAAQSMASGLMDEGRRKATEYADRAEQISRPTRRYAKHLAEEQPILVAAIGAAIGAALPVSDAERHDLNGDRRQR